MFQAGIYRLSLGLWMGTEVFCMGNHLEIPSYGRKWAAVCFPSLKLRLPKAKNLHAGLGDEIVTAF
jgi:hypothetical protein